MSVVLNLGYTLGSHWGTLKTCECLASNPEFLPELVPYMAWTLGFMKASRWHPRQKFRA